jgi:5-methylcytosine-specific restriction endonuclease McrA
MRLTPQSLERRRAQRRALKETKRRNRVERQAAQRTALRPRDEHTGGYGDPPYEP